MPISKLALGCLGKMVFFAMVLKRSAKKREGGFRRKTNGRPNDGKKIQNCLLFQT